MVQEPAPVRCTVEPVTVQLPEAAKLTARPELAAGTNGEIRIIHRFVSQSGKRDRLAALLAVASCETSVAVL